MAETSKSRSKTMINAMPLSRPRRAQRIEGTGCDVGFCIIPPKVPANLLSVVVSATVADQRHNWAHTRLGVISAGAASQKIEGDADGLDASGVIARKNLLTRCGRVVHRRVDRDHSAGLIVSGEHRVIFEGGDGGVVGIIGSSAASEKHVRSEERRV